MFQELIDSNENLQTDDILVSLIQEIKKGIIESKEIIGDGIKESKSTEHVALKFSQVADTIDAEIKLSQTPENTEEQIQSGTASSSQTMAAYFQSTISKQNKSM